MSKEWLEEAKKLINHYHEQKRSNNVMLTERGVELIEHLYGQAEQKQSLETTVDFYQSALKDADKRVQELERQLKVSNSVHADDRKLLNRRTKQNKRYREALNKSREVWDKTYEHYNQDKTEYLDGRLDGLETVINILEESLEESK